jgi:hypothetical protein
VILGVGTNLTSSYINPASGWLNSNIEINSNGTLSGAGGGSVSLSGLGAGIFATASQLTSSSISTYIASAAIGNALIGTAAVGTLNIGANQVIVPNAAVSGGTSASTSVSITIQNGQPVNLFINAFISGSVFGWSSVSSLPQRYATLSYSGPSGSGNLQSSFAYGVSVSDGNTAQLPPMPVSYILTASVSGTYTFTISSGDSYGGNSAIQVLGIQR